MTTEARDPALEPEAAAELTILGKRLEILRIERGFSKQRLARHAGTSRQQLWRVMTGKSELTHALQERLASALAVESAVILTGAAGASQAFTFSPSSVAHSPPHSDPAVTASEYLEDPHYLATTLRTLPGGDGGRRLKRALLNALEDLAAETSHAFPADYSDIHRRVLAGEL